MTQEMPKATIWVIIPPPIWALLFFLAAWLGGKAIGLEPVFRHVAAGWIVFAIGFAISASGNISFKLAKTEVVPVSKKNSALVVTGPYHFTRNPMYLGILVGLVGLSVVLGTLAGPAAIIACFLLVNFVSIPYEEKKMEAQFGADYLAYKRRARRWV
ncbi:MAG: isoprenylcysteine carboxylmethyltransferase family protein [Parvularculaceae bacterium]